MFLSIARNFVERRLALPITVTESHVFPQGWYEICSDFDLRNSFHRYYSICWVWKRLRCCMLAMIPMIFLVGGWKQSGVSRGTESFHLSLFPGIFKMLWVLLLYSIFKASLCSEYMRGNGKVSWHWEKKLLLKTGCSIGAQVFQMCCAVHTSIVSTQLLVLPCSWRQLLTVNWPE